MRRSRTSWSRGSTGGREGAHRRQRCPRLGNLYDLRLDRGWRVTDAKLAPALAKAQGQEILPMRYRSRHRQW